MGKFRHKILCFKIIFIFFLKIFLTNKEVWEYNKSAFSKRQVGSKWCAQRRVGW